MKQYKNWFQFENRCWLVVILVISLVVWSRQIHIGGFSWSDAPLHAMDGVFVGDVFHAISQGHLQSWAKNYYLRYPCLGIVVFYPPLFALVEAIFFGLFGISVITARLTVIFFGLGGILAIYWVARQLFDRTAAIFTAGLWASLPATVLWSRQVMLEVPTTAMILATCGCYLQYKSNKSILFLVLTAVGLVLSVFTKQWAIFFGAVILIDLIRTVGLKKAFASRHALTMGACMVIIGAYMVVSSRYAALSKYLVWENGGWQHVTNPDHWLYYLRALPHEQVLSWPMMGFAGLGFLLAASNRQIKKLRVPLLWAVVFYLFASLIYYKEPRYFYLITPAGVLIAAGGLSFGLEKTKLQFAGRGLLTFLMLFQFAYGWGMNPDRLSSYEPAAKMILDNRDANLILVDATREGQFIFDMRRLQGSEGNVYTLRASKLLYSRAARKKWGYQEYVQTEQEILQLIQNYGIRYIVVESAPPVIPDWEDFFPKPSQLLRKVLRDSRLFEKLASWPISDDPAWNGVYLEVFRYNGPVTNNQTTLKIPMPSMGRDIEIALPKTTLAP